jgi:hypothetical protein
MSPTESVAGRVLLTTHRAVDPDRRDAYEEAWVRARDAVTAAGGNAWRYRSRNTSGQFIECIEYREADPRGQRGVVEALARLERCGAGEAEEWTDATVSASGTEEA